MDASMSLDVSLFFFCDNWKILLQAMFVQTHQLTYKKKEVKGIRLLFFSFTNYKIKIKLNKIIIIKNKNQLKTKTSNYLFRSMLFTIDDSTFHFYYPIFLPIIFIYIFKNKNTHENNWLLLILLDNWKIP